ncbi:GntR family transcriptional regulator [Microbacterium invictum]|uniref:GntR family transcriptional regulator n=1 Tax=Microbacterium invictum TaxID=515415 RepID=UPI0033734F0C
MSETIERTSPVPYYEQLFGILRDRIAEGSFETDERLPSEHELCREFGLSRATVRQTLAKLESEGYAKRVARRGMFASTPEESTGWTVQDTQGFLELQIRHGRNGVDTQVLDASLLTPPSHAREALRVAADEEVFVLERLRSRDGELAMYSTNWFPGAAGAAIAATADVLDGSGSANSTLRAAGFVTSGARRVVESLPAPEVVAKHLQVDVGRPVLRIRSTSWDQNDFRFDYYETWVLTDVVPLEINVASN